MAEIARILKREIGCGGWYRKIKVIQFRVRPAVRVATPANKSLIEISSLASGNEFP